jgi:hypothetical protein
MTPSGMRTCCFGRQRSPRFGPLSCATQILPFGDPVSFTRYMEFEKSLYQT